VRPDCKGEGPPLTFPESTGWVGPSLVSVFRFLVTGKDGDVCEGEDEEMGGARTVMCITVIYALLRFVGFCSIPCSDVTGGVMVSRLE
jgi:hypothetical protein